MATVLSQYFVSSVPAEVMQAVAEDWQHELKDYPAWAINAACRWWMGSENEKRRQRPLPGDIAARAHEEMMPVRFASLKLKSFNRSEHQPPAQVITHDRFVDIEGKRERADDILKKAGFTPRRFGGAQ